MRKRALYIVLAIVSILSYNAFLIQRDQKMFDAYYETKSVQQ